MSLLDSIITDDADDFRPTSSLIGTEIRPFNATAYHDNGFIEVSEADVYGKWSIFFFYPADFTFVCPTELTDMAAHYEEFKALGVEVYSVSTDTHFAHLAWHSSSPMISSIRFPMIGDPTGTITRNLGVMIEEDGLADRGTFVVDPDGIIQVLEITAGSIGRSAAELLRKVKAAQYVRENPGEVCPANWAQGSDTLRPGADIVGKL